MTVIIEILNSVTLIMGLVIGKTDKKAIQMYAIFLHRVVLVFL